MNPRHSLLHTTATLVLAIVATLILVSTAWAGAYFEKSGSAWRR